MRIRPSRRGHAAAGGSHAYRRRPGVRRGWAAAAAALALVIGLLLPTAADAAPSTFTLTGTVTPGNPVVTFKGNVVGSAPTDSLYLCFGDETPVACSTSNAATAGTLVTLAAITAGVTHTYSVVKNYTARLYDVPAGTAPKVAVTSFAFTITPIDATARLTAKALGLVVTLDGSRSTATAGDTWWACFGEKLPCTAASADASGTVATTNGVPTALTYTYLAPGTYPTSLTVVGKFVTSTATASVTVNFLDPHAVLTADQTTGTGNLAVTFDGSKSVSSANDTWAFCYGDVPCTQTAPDLTGTFAVALPPIPHNYPAGNYTATLYVKKGGTTSTATVSIAVANSVAAPDGTCSIVGVLRTCDLFAKATGKVSVGTSTIPFWGFTTTAAGTPVLGGPKLVATVGEKLAFTVHNQLDPKAGNVSITVPSLMGAPDLVGVAPGGTGPSGTFTLTTPGTYIYEAGVTSGGERQVAMGLSGLLVVRPSVLNSADSAHCAYSSSVALADCIAVHEPGNYFDREKVVVVNELDEKYNADPFGSDTGDYHPTHFFLDGVAYDPAKTAALDPSDPGFNPAADNVRFDGAPGDVVLLRYADLGLREHSLNLTNLLQTETARDANLLPGSHIQNTEFLNAGQTADTFVTIPADATTGTTYPLSDAGLHLNNGDQAGLGGMYAVVDVVNGATAGNTGPVGSAADVNTTFDPTAPNVDNGQVPTLDVTATFAAKSPSTVKSVGWALDSVAGVGLWQDSGYVTPNPGSATVTVKFTVTPAALLTLLGNEPGRVFGDHTIWLQAVDSSNTPGPAIGAVFTLAMRNPVISALSINPKVTNGATRPNQFPSVSTKQSALSDNQTIPQSTINVDSTKGFPGTCARPGLPTPVDNGCLMTVGMSIAGGTAADAIVYATFTYTGLTATSFTGVAPTTDIPAYTYQLGFGNTVVLDDVPAGYIAVNGTATASLPGFAVGAAQACVLAGPAAAPTSADSVDAKCDPGITGPGQVVYGLNIDSPAPLAPVYGFLPTPALPAGLTDSSQFWVMVRAQEGPSGESCSQFPLDCRWSPWVYYNPNPTGGVTADPSTYETLTLVTTGPTTGPVTVTPNPNNGFDAAAGNLGLFDAFNVSATASSQWATISLAEAFVATTSRAVGDLPPADPLSSMFGTGAEMAPVDGFWNNNRTKPSTAFLPLSELQGMPDGLVRVWVHAKDIAGNWGPLTATDLTLDHSVPTLVSVTLAAAAGTATVVAQDAVTNGVSTGVAAAEWFLGADPGPGNGTNAVTTPAPIPAASPLGSGTTFTITGLPTGRTVHVRVVDAAGNWSTTSDVKT